MHWLLAGGYYPDGGVRYRKPASWLPQPSLRLDRYVDHMCRMLLGRPSTSLDLKAAARPPAAAPPRR